MQYDLLIQNISSRSDTRHIDGHYKFLFFNPTKNTMVINNQTSAKNLTLYLLGEIINENNLKEDLCKVYGINVLSPEYKLFKLPSKV